MLNKAHMPKPRNTPRVLPPRAQGQEDSAIFGSFVYEPVAVARGHVPKAVGAAHSNAGAPNASNPSAERKRAREREIYDLSIKVAYGKVPLRAGWERSARRGKDLSVRWLLRSSFRYLAESGANKSADPPGVRRLEYFSSPSFCARR